ncbi:MAG: malate dehydrogenase [Caldisphaeraceae archaeon]|nr:malate dehydrogenase [Caldisphaeraceae archaeon]MEB3691772.1 malate dehydrogenase [Caldisphaeraceae archaeon]MEB3798584.1 malate dehydrogenase [Caldisphaeraceae archaeon]
MITVVGGGGKVGVTTGAFLLIRDVDDVMLIDIIKDKPQGEALDLGHMLSVIGSSRRVTGSNDYKDMAGSDVVIITAGFPRKAGQTREELLAMNAKVMSEVSAAIKEYAPNAKVLVLTNPLDAMVYVVYKKLGVSRNSVIGFSGILDSSRLSYYASQKLGISPASITPVVLGMHGESMFPVPRLSMVGGVPLSNLMSKEQVEEVVNRTVKAGAEVIKLRGYSSNWAPAAGLALMAEAIKKDQKKALIASVILQGEYGVNDVVAEVPIILGKEGVEKVLEVPLTEEEKEGFMKSVEAVRNLLASLPPEYR